MTAAGSFRTRTTRLPRKTEFGSIISVIWHLRRHPRAFGRIATEGGVYTFFTDGIERAGKRAPPTPWYLSGVEFADDQRSVFERAGGLAACTRMTRLFYEKRSGRPAARPVVRPQAPDHLERVAAWLAETFGGPTTYTYQYGVCDRTVSQRQGKALTEAQRARWAQLMCQCTDEAGLPTDPEFRAAFLSYIECRLADCRRKIRLRARPAADAYARAPLVVGSRSESGRPLIRTCPPTKGASHVYTDSRRRA